MHFFYTILCILGFCYVGAVRTIQDARLDQAVNCPAANANVVSGSIDFNTGPHMEEIELQVSLPACPNLVDAHAITMTLVHSSDNATWVAIPELQPLVATGAGGVGSPAVSDTYRLPSSTLEYVALKVAVANGGGDSTAIQASLVVLM